ncbi:MAG: 2-amino-4-hydroxy-6-hydroxymethyldihydropteridine diphosphokinase [Gammaproteobacteria bacterium]|nr:2-amino-4-hydroxy-6-hydroxymethyldihydropteridine diphosphokinase [Gammaproteobacteria bacterium]
MAADSGQRWLPAYIGLGSNLQSPARQLDSAMDLLASIRETRLITRSSLYRSAPFGGIEQPDFVNAAASLLTSLTAQDLLAELQQIEQRRGRERDDVRWGPRVIDLDLLVFSDQVVAKPGLKVPHPGIAERNFVLLPLREIAPELVIPGLGRVASLPVNREEPHIERLY